MFGKGDLGVSKVLRVAPEAWEAVVVAAAAAAAATDGHAALDSDH